MCLPGILFQSFFLQNRKFGHKYLLHCHPVRNFANRLQNYHSIDLLYLRVFGNHQYMCLPGILLQSFSLRSRIFGHKYLPGYHPVRNYPSRLQNYHSIDLLYLRLFGDHQYMCLPGILLQSFSLRSRIFGHKYLPGYHPVRNYPSRLQNYHSIDLLYLGLIDNNQYMYLLEILLRFFPLYSQRSAHKYRKD